MAQRDTESWKPFRPTTSDLEALAKDVSEIGEIQKTLVDRHNHDRAIFIQANLAQPEEAERAVSQAAQTFGSINAVVNSAGIQRYGAAEQTPLENTGRLNGVQLWVALPNAHRDIEPAFAAMERVPLIERLGARVHVFAGALEQAHAPGPHYSPLVAADVQIDRGASIGADETLRLAEAVRVLAVRHGPAAVQHCIRLVESLRQLLDSVTGTEELRS